MKIAVKSVLASLLLTGVGLPAIATAQTAATDPSIVVTGKFKKDWEKGSEMEREGLEDLRKAEEDLADANRDVIDAQSKRDNNRDRAENSSEEFYQLTANIPAGMNGEEAHDWAKKVEEAAKRWAKSTDRRDDGREDLRDAMEDQEKAQDAVDKANSKIEKGRKMMAEAEQRSLRAGRD